MENYYLALEKKILDHFIDFLKILGQLNLLNGLFLVI